MINFNSLKLIVPDNYSFVGIQKKDNELYFYLPKGFDARLSELDTFVGKRDLFFLLYKIFGTFKEICIEKGYIDDLDEFGTQDRDGVINSHRGSEIEDEEDDSENIFYSKLDIITNFLKAYEEPKILALAYRLGKSNKFDVSQIHKYLHQAVYLPNHAAYVDEMLLPRRVMQFESTDIVTMYCYIFCEIKQQLGEVVNAEITALAERFRQHHLGNQDSLFDEHSYEQVLDILKDALETIDHNTPIKDADYWQYYEAIKLFIYGNWHHAENGEIWGIKNFHSVWESMCLTYIVQITDPSLLLHLDDRYLSSKTVERAKLSTKLINLSNAFNINGSSLKPDAIVFESITNKIKGDKTYKVYANNWNDYGYKTIIKCLNIDSNPSVGYIGQETNNHTINKLQELYKIDSSGKVIINAPLPNNFYSFWEIDFPLDLESLHQMYYFNHFFYLALTKQITDWDRFNKEILQPLGIFSGSLYKGSRDDVFNASLFRDKDYKLIGEKFNNFIRHFLNQDECFCEIIDIKYLDTKYFQDPNKIEEIKRRSVRKQFVYEHLLQKALEKRNDQYSNLSIRSSFWLPSYLPDDSELLQDSSTFMDGYIKFKNVNFKLLAENYLG
ncbi:hypothetical protein IQ270_17310 [Microcoleus sp. LEGE 07076]|uniref:hypothetical protein n=1 Tax=Microcoleus sp. LEGE 07076 TaxID=915322 RepID=UPI0018822F9D|nr:hypothetical protein [Microcoleus sp. LEGE 07076]MBE9186392.1 hypothetical protein [Microcoleus sp. LEGE 07076]